MISYRTSLSVVLHYGVEGALSKSSGVFPQLSVAPVPGVLTSLGERDGWQGMCTYFEKELPSGFLSLHFSEPALYNPRRPWELGSPLGARIEQRGGLQLTHYYGYPEVGDALSTLKTPTQGPRQAAGEGTAHTLLGPPIAWAGQVAFSNHSSRRKTGNFFSNHSLHRH